MRRRALSVAHDRREHDRAIDLRTAPLTRRRGRGFENSFQVLRNKNLRRPVGLTTGYDLANVGGDLSGQSPQIDA